MRFEDVKGSIGNDDIRDFVAKVWAQTILFILFAMKLAQVKVSFSNSTFLEMGKISVRILKITGNVKKPLFQARPISGVTNFSSSRI